MNLSIHSLKVINIAISSLIIPARKANSGMKRKTKINTMSESFENPMKSDPCTVRLFTSGYSVNIQNREQLYYLHCQYVIQQLHNYNIYD